MIKWISVDDQPIPRNSKPILVYLAGANLGSRVHTGVFHPQCSFVGGEFAFNVPKITHWAIISNTPNDFRKHRTFKRKKMTGQHRRINR